MEPRRVLKWASVLSILALLAVLLVDRPLAVALQPSARQAQAATGPAMHVLELAFGFPISKFLTGAVLLLAAAALFPFRRYRRAAWLLTLLGLAQLTTRLAAGVLKNVFLRPRPFEALDTGAWDFFTAGSSFPSGHAAHFWPFFFVSMLAFPRWRIPLLVLAIAVSISRVVVNDHFLGDVLGSAAIAALVSYGYGRWIVPRMPVPRVAAAS
ncbi:MAG TPA: phosphatase PAP2 family protein [Thermoanaerobaculia bacterium]